MSRVFLHVGAPKTGTTYLQDVLWSNRAALARQGALYWGNDPGAHFYAAQDLRGRYFRGHRHPQVPGAWERLAGAVRDWSGPTALISHEILAGCDPEEAQRAVASLRPHEVHVVYTARDLARQIPAMWQESVKNGRVVPYPRYLQTLRAEDPELVGRIFWRTQDAVAVLDRWAQAVPTERIHVLTVPPRGTEPDLLWRRLCGLTGLDAHGLDAVVADASGTRGNNVSLGLAEAELLRRINRRLQGDLTWPEHEALLKNFLTRSVLTDRAGTTRPGLPASERAWVLERSRAQVEGLRRRAYDVVGSLDELVPAFEGVPDASAQPSADDVLDAAVDALAVLLTEHVGARRSPTTARLRGLAGAVRARLPGRPLRSALRRW
jgi:hypothetical protein